MIARYMKPRESSFKKFTKTSLTIPGLAKSIPEIIQECATGQPVRVHKSGTYDDEPSLDRISPFQRGFELTDMASSYDDMEQQLNDMSERLSSERKRTAHPAQSAEGAPAKPDTVIAEGGQ